jgi:hypothetical protein
MSAEGKSLEERQAELASLKAQLKEQMSVHSVEHQQFFKTLEQLSILVEEEPSLSSAAFDTLYEAFGTRIANGLREMTGLPQRVEVDKKIVKKIARSVDRGAIAEFETYYNQVRGKKGAKQSERLANLLTRNDLFAEDNLKETENFVEAILESQNIKSFERSFGYIPLFGPEAFTIMKDFFTMKKEAFESKNNS